MAIYQAQQLGNSPWFKIDQVRDLLRVLNIGYAGAGGHARDTHTRIFLSAAAHVLEQSGIDTVCGRTGC
jgi:hypothetical protein